DVNRYALGREHAFGLSGEGLGVDFGEETAGVENHFETRVIRARLLARASAVFGLEVFSADNRSRHVGEYRLAAYLAALAWERDGCVLDCERAFFAVLVYLLLHPHLLEFLLAFL